MLKHLRYQLGLLAVVALASCQAPPSRYLTMIVAPSKLAFVINPPMTSTPEQFIEITDTGTENLEISSLAMARANDLTLPPDGYLTTNCWGAQRDTKDPLQVMAGECVRVYVAFTPSGFESITNSVVIVSNDSKTPVVSIRVTGLYAGTSAECAASSLPSVSLSAANVNGPIAEGATVTPGPVTLLATASGSVANYDWNILSGPSASITASGQSAVINAYESGTYELSVTVASSTGCLSVAATFTFTIVLPVLPPCEANPITAKIETLASNGPVTGSVPPLTNVTFLGGGSSTASGAPITSYSWALTNAPANNPWTLMPEGDSGSVVTLYTGVTGDYTVQLTVTDAMSCTATASFSFSVVPGPGIHVELTWDQDIGDLDLHYIGPGGQLFDNFASQADYIDDPSYPQDGDLFYIYSLQTLCGNQFYGPDFSFPTPDWGGNGTIAPDGTSWDDASLDVDQRCGTGPENVTHAHPFDGDFEVMIHEWCSGNYESPTVANAPLTAVVKVFFDGSLVWSGTQDLIYDQVWDAAKISIADGGTAATVVPGAGFGPPDGTLIPIINAGDGEGCAADVPNFAHRHFSKGGQRALR